MQQVGGWWRAGGGGGGWREPETEWTLYPCFFRSVAGNVHSFPTRVLFGSHLFFFVLVRKESNGWLVRRCSSVVESTAVFRLGHG